MQITYNEAIAQVYKDEGGYSNDVGDSGGPTNYGITIWDARKYWKAGATAQDVKSMTKDVAAKIYEEHYAHPLAYDQLPAGVDYAVLDYGINSGISRSTKVVQKIVGVTVDGIMGPTTLAAINKFDSVKLINLIYDEREAFLKGLGKPQFIKGWLSRTKRGRALALSLASKYKVVPVRPPVHTAGAGSIVVVGGAAAAAAPHHAWWIIPLALIAGVSLYLILRHKN